MDIRLEENITFFLAVGGAGDFFPDNAKLFIETRWPHQTNQKLKVEGQGPGAKTCRGMRVRNVVPVSCPVQWADE